MNHFSAKSIEALGSYVYALVDPRDNKIFYIGKGVGNRIFRHCAAAIEGEEKSLKLNQIRDILAAGLQVKHYILRHKLSESEAYTVESTLIDLLTYPHFNTEHLLTNIVSGHHQWDEGIKTVEDIAALYDCEKLQPQPGDRLLLVSLNRSFDSVKAGHGYQRVNIYEKTRKYWYISRQRAARVDYVLGVYHGIVRSVIKVDDYYISNRDEDAGITFARSRVGFIGQLLSESPYLNKDTADFPFGSGAAVRYVGA